MSGYILTDKDRYLYFSSIKSFPFSSLYYGEDTIHNDSLLYHRRDQILFEYACFMNKNKGAKITPYLLYVEKDKLPQCEYVIDEIRNIATNEQKNCKYEIHVSIMSQLSYRDYLQIMHMNKNRKINYIIYEKIHEDHIDIFNIKNYDIIISHRKDEFMTIIYDEEIDPMMRLIYTKDQIIG